MVAIKLLRADMAADSSFQQRFRRESRMAARLQNPHVIPVHDFGEIDGVLFIDMRLVEGPSVKEELRVNGALPPARTVSIVAQVAAALDAAHANGLVHRDIKPENVLLTADDFAYLVDFGIAHGGGEASVTSTGLVIGSCAYMAPERINGGRGGPASDVYSLTCLLYEALTGRAPFASGDLRAIMGAHLFSPPPRPSTTHPALSPAFDDVIARGMAKDPADRYRSAGELARAATAAAATAAASRTDAPHPAPIPSPPHTRQFSGTDPNPAASGPGPRLPFPAPPASPPRTTSRTAPILVIVIAVMFAVAALLAAVLVSGNDTGDPETPTRLAGPTPTTSAAPSASDETTSADPTTPRQRRRRPQARPLLPGCREQTRRASSGTRRAAMREARPRRRSGRRTRLRWCARHQRATSTTAANDCATVPTWSSPMPDGPATASKQSTPLTARGIRCNRTC